MQDKKSNYKFYEILNLLSNITLSEEEQKELLQTLQSKVNYYAEVIKGCEISIAECDRIIAFYQKEKEKAVVVKNEQEQKLKMIVEKQGEQVITDRFHKMVGRIKVKTTKSLKVEYPKNIPANYMKKVADQVNVALLKQDILKGKIECPEGVRITEIKKLKIE